MGRLLPSTFSSRVGRRKRKSGRPAARVAQPDDGPHAKLVGGQRRGDRAQGDRSRHRRRSHGHPHLLRSAGARAKTRADRPRIAPPRTPLPPPPPPVHPPTPAPPPPTPP